MIDPESLKVGQCYFMVSYLDNSMRIPEIETYIYVGKNLYPEDGNNGRNFWYFQNPETYLKTGAFNEQPPGDHGVLRAMENILEAMCNDFDGLINTLSEIQNRGS